jgi:hypothetical protein
MPEPVVIASIITAAAQAFDSIKGGKGTSGGIPSEFRPFLNQVFGVVDNALQQSQAFPLTLDQFIDPQFLQGALEQRNAGLQQFFSEGLGSGIETFGQGIESLQNLLAGTDIEGLEGLLRPAAERSKDFLTADVAESAARFGQTRSTGTVDAIGRGVEGIESNLLQQIAGLVPAGLQAQAQGIGASFGLPGLFGGMLQGPITEGIGLSQFGQTLPFQAMQAGAAGLSEIPFIAPSGKSGGK